MEYHLRALKAPEAIGESFRLYFSNFGKLILIVLAFMGIPILLEVFVFAGPMTSFLSDAATNPTAMLGLLPRMSLFYIIFGLGYLMFFIYLTAWISRTYLGQDLQGGTPWQLMWKKLWKTFLTGLLISIIAAGAIIVAVIVIALLTGLAAVAGGASGGITVVMTILMIALYIAFFWYLISVSFAFPSVILENAGPWTSIQRSFTLVKGERWRILGTYILMLLIIYAVMLVPMFIYSLATGNGLGNLFTGGAGFAGYLSVSMIVGVFLMPVMFFPIILLYFSVRVKKEDFHLEQINNQWESASNETGSGEV